MRLAPRDPALLAGAAAGFLAVYGPMLVALARGLADEEARRWLFKNVTGVAWPRGVQLPRWRGRLVLPTTRRSAT